MLSNLQSEDQSLLQIMLVGQPELIAKLKQPSMRQFSQRIAASYHLTGLDRQETGNYIAHRLKMVGGDPDSSRRRRSTSSTSSPAASRARSTSSARRRWCTGLRTAPQKIGQDTIKHISQDNLGIGLGRLVRRRQRPRPAAAAAAGHNGNGFDRKLGVLEADIKDLKQIVIGPAPGYGNAIPERSRGPVPAGGRAPQAGAPAKARSCCARSSGWKSKTST